MRKFIVAALLLATSSVQAATITVPLSSKVNFIITGGGPYQTGLTTGNQGGTIPMLISDQGPNPLAVRSSTSLTVDIDNPLTAYALLNNANGTLGSLEYRVTFGFESGASLAFNAIGGSDTRSLIQGSFTNTINGTTTRPFYVSPNGGRFDIRAFDLSAFANDSVTQFSVTQINGSNLALLMGLTFVTRDQVVPAPAPSSLALLAFVFTPLALRLRRR
jgi:hypothetical protein